MYKSYKISLIKIPYWFIWNAKIPPKNQSIFVADFKGHDFIQRKLEKKELARKCEL
jgi:hypothetical protein